MAAALAAGLERLGPGLVAGLVEAHPQLVPLQGVDAPQGLGRDLLTSNFDELTTSSR